MADLPNSPGSGTTKAAELTISGDIRRLRLKPGDVLVVRIDDKVSDVRLYEIQEVVQQTLRTAGITNRVFVHGKNASFSVVSGDQFTEGEGDRG